MSNNCSQPGQIVSCVCPIDYIGERCNRHLGVDCNFTLIEPQPKCDNNTVDSYYLDDPVCYEYNVSDIVTISFNATCKFKGVDIKINASDIGNFTYLVVTDTVALSAPTNSHAVLRIYNFNRFTEYLNVSPTANFTKEIMSGSPLTFSLNMSSLLPNYAIGGRVYADLRVKHDWGFFSDVSGLKHSFVFDLMDWVDPVPRKDNTNVPVVVAAVVIPVVAVVGGIIAFFCWRKRKAQREEAEELKALEARNKAGAIKIRYIG